MVRYKIHYKSPPSPFERTARLILVPVIAALLAIGAACQPSSSSSGSGLHQQGNFSPRTATVPESVQLTPCQRSAAACFASGGLDTLMDNLDGLAIDPVTGRFCFSFQEGCRR